jgi:hypothetical protein
MMLSVIGTFRKGIAQPAEPVAGHEGQPVIITFLDDGRKRSFSTRDIAKGRARLRKLIDKSKIKTGISDLAHQHDHYLHGAPKKK